MRLFSMMNFAILSATVLLLSSACVLGPVEITHKEGELPKLHVNLGYEECKLRVKARKHELAAFTDDERVMYGAHTRMILRSYFNAYNLLKEDLITEDQWNTLTPSVVREASRRAFLGFWKTARGDFPQDFAEMIDRAMKSETLEL